MERRQFVLCGSVLASLPLLGCGDDEGGSSGSNNSGGTASGSGGETGSTGGSTNGSTGGSTNGSTGGSTSSGGGNMGGSGGGGDACTGDIEGESTGNTDGFPHEHIFTLPLSAILAGDPTDFELEDETPGGQALQHSHTVELTAQDLATLRAGGTVTKESIEEDEGDHRHTVTLSCV